MVLSTSVRSKISEGSLASPSALTACILYVEDDPCIVELVCHLFRDKSFQFDVCESAEEALELLKKKSYDLLILDIVLPGISGKELSNKLSEIFDTPPPVIFISALVKDYIEEGSADIKVWEKAHIQKPIPYAELLSTVDAQIRLAKSLPSFNSSRVLAKADKLSIALQHYLLLESQSFVQSAPFLASLISSIAQDVGNSLVTIQAVSSILNSDDSSVVNPYEEESKALAKASKDLAIIMSNLVELVRSGFGGQRSENRIESISMNQILSISLFISSGFLEKQSIKSSLSIECDEVHALGQLGEFVKLLLFAVDEFYDINKSLDLPREIVFFARIIGGLCCFGVEMKLLSKGSLHPLNLYSPSLLCAKTIAEHRGLAFDIIESASAQSMRLSLPKTSKNFTGKTKSAGGSRTIL